MNEAMRNNIFSEISSIADPVLISSTQFFEGNEDAASIGRNVVPHPGIEIFRNVFRDLAERPDVSGIYMMIADANPLLNWPFTDTVYIAGTIPTTELSKFLRPLQPDETGPVSEFEYDVPQAITEKHPGEPVQLAWWDS